MKIFEYEHELQVLVYSVYTPWRLIVELEQSAHLHHASNRSSSSRWLSRTQLSDRLEIICSQRSIDVDDGQRRDGDSADRIDLPLARQRHTSREPPTQPPAPCFTCWFRPFAVHNCSCNINTVPVAGGQFWRQVDV